MRERHLSHHPTIDHIDISLTQKAQSQIHISHSQVERLLIVVLSQHQHFSSQPNHKITMANEPRYGELPAHRSPANTELTKEPVEHGYDLVQAQHAHRNNHDPRTPRPHPRLQLHLLQNQLERRHRRLLLLRLLMLARRRNRALLLRRL